MADNPKCVNCGEDTGERGILFHADGRAVLFVPLGYLEALQDALQWCAKQTDAHSFALNFRDGGIEFSSYDTSIFLSKRDES